MTRFRSLIPTAILALGCTFLSAEDARFGVQGALSFPTNDLTDTANPGIQVGGHALWDFGRGHGLMARADLGLYGSKDGFSTTSLGGGADYTYHIDRNGRGLYFLGGVTFISFNTSGYGHSSSSNGLGIDVGVGYDLDRHLGFQARYMTHNIDSATLSSLNLGVTYTF